MSNDFWVGYRLLFSESENRKNVLGFYILLHLSHNQIVKLAVREFSYYFTIVLKAFFKNKNQ